MYWTKIKDMIQLIACTLHKLGNNAKGVKSCEADHLGAAFESGDAEQFGHAC